MNTTNPELTVAVWQAASDMESPSTRAVAQAREEYPTAEMLGVRQLSEHPAIYRGVKGRWIEMAVEMRFI